MQSCRSQLDGQWQSVQAADDLADPCSIGCRQGRTRAGPPVPAPGTAPRRGRLLSAVVAGSDTAARPAGGGALGWSRLRGGWRSTGAASRGASATGSSTCSQLSSRRARGAAPITTARRSIVDAPGRRSIPSAAATASIAPSAFAMPSSHNTTGRSGCSIRQPVADFDHQARLADTAWTDHRDEAVLSQPGPSAVDSRASRPISDVNGTGKCGAMARRRPRPVRSSSP